MKIKSITLTHLILIGLMSFSCRSTEDSLNAISEHIMSLYSTEDTKTQYDVKSNYYIEVESHDIEAEVRINDMSVIRTTSRQRENASANITTSVKNGENAISVFMNDTSVVDSAQISIKILQVSTNNRSNKEVIFEQLISTTILEQINLHASMQIAMFEGVSPVEAWGWQSAQKIDINKNKSELVRYVTRLYDEFANKNESALLDMQRVKYAELAIASQQDLSDVQEDVRWTYSSIFDDNWALEPLNIDDALFTVEANGRVVHITHKDGSPLIQSLESAKPFKFDVNVSLLIINNKKQFFAVR